MAQGAEYMRQWRAKPSNREAEQRRARELAALAKKAQAAEIIRLESELRDYQAREKRQFPLLLGFQSGRAGLHFDERQPADWQVGWRLGVRRRKKR